ncbi:DHH family phosphoesterase [Candidatus Bathyarchaeota archaeon]|nr:DHH family phosphoesterase [Candidatus Bathyarchaeota archaeon]
MNLDHFKEQVTNVISELRHVTIKKVTLVHHDDADGICSGAITKAALEREGYRIRTFCLEKVYPEVIQNLHSIKNEIIFYCDIGSSHAQFISESNSGRNLVIILDHHDPTPATDPKVHDLNLEHFNFRGETDFSGAACCYLFARAFNSQNRDLVYLALVGSCEIPQGFTGINKQILEEANQEKVVRPKGKTFEITRLGVTLNDLFSILQILGSVGYYKGGPELGIKACLEGITPEIKRLTRQLEEKRKQANKTLLSRLLREGLNETEHIQWFDAENTYRGMGTKVIGTFCSFLSYQQRLVNQHKYLLGFTDVPPEIPGYGKLKEKYVKASIRVPKPMQTRIDAGELLPAFELLAKASEKFGIADGHAYAANVVIPHQQKEELIRNAERILHGRS